VDLLAEILYGKEKLYPGTPLSRIANVPERKISFIQVSNLGGNPFLCIICGISSCSTLSKVFSKSSLRMINSFILDGSMFYKTILVLMNQGGHYHVKSVGQNLGDYFNGGVEQ